MPSWWDLGAQASRAGNAVQNMFGGGVKTDPDDYDWEGNKKRKPPVTGFKSIAPKPVNLNPTTGITPTQGSLTPPPGYMIGTELITQYPKDRPLSPSEGQSIVDTHTSGHEALQSGGGATGTPPTPKSGYAGLLDQMLKDKMARDKDNQKRLNQTYIDIQGWRNPYDPNSAQFQQVRSNALDGVTRRFNSLEAQAQGNLGPASQGARFGGFAALSRGRAMGLADTEAAVNYKGMQDAQNFDSRKMGLLASLATSQREDPSSLALSMLGREDAREAMDQDIIATIIQTLPALAKVLGLLV